MLIHRNLLEISTTVTIRRSFDRISWLRPNYLLMFHHSSHLHKKNHWTIIIIGSICLYKSTKYKVQLICTCIHFHRFSKLVRMQLTNVPIANTLCECPLEHVWKFPASFLKDRNTIHIKTMDLCCTAARQLLSFGLDALPAFSHILWNNWKSKSEIIKNFTS